MSTPRTPAQSAQVEALNNASKAIWLATVNVLDAGHPNPDPVAARASIDGAVAAYAAEVLASTPTTSDRKALREGATKIAEVGLGFLEGANQLFEVFLAGERTTSRDLATACLGELVLLNSAAVGGRLPA